MATQLNKRRIIIVGGGFGGLAAAALLIRNAGVPGHDITIYEADEQLGGGFFLDGSSHSGYNLPGSVFDKEYRCAFDLLATIPTADERRFRRTPRVEAHVIEPMCLADLNDPPPFRLVGRRVAGQREDAAFQRPA